MITVYGMTISGNCHKIQLLLALLGSDRIAGSRSTAPTARRARPNSWPRNPIGKVPVLELEDGRILTESNAILCYLAEGSRYLPEDHWQRAQVLQWLFFEQYSHEPYIAVARFICLLAGRRITRAAANCRVCANAAIRRWP